MDATRRHRRAPTRSASGTPCQEWAVCSSGFSASPIRGIWMLTPSPAILVQTAASSVLVPCQSVACFVDTDMCDGTLTMIQQIHLGPPRRMNERNATPTRSLDFLQEQTVPEDDSHYRHRDSSNYARRNRDRLRMRHRACRILWRAHAGRRPRTRVRVRQRNVSDVIQDEWPIVRPMCDVQLQDVLPGRKLARVVEYLSVRRLTHPVDCKRATDDAVNRKGDRGRGCARIARWCGRDAVYDYSRACVDPILKSSVEVKSMKATYRRT